MHFFWRSLVISIKSYSNFFQNYLETLGSTGFCANGHIAHDCMVQMEKNPMKMGALGVYFQIQKVGVEKWKGVNFSCKPYAKYLYVFGLKLKEFDC